MPGIERAAMQPERRRQVEARGRPPRLQHDRAESVEGGCLLGDPERIGELLRLCDEQAGRIDAVEEAHARRIGIARLAKAFRQADPQKGGACLLGQEAGESQN